MFTPCAKAGGQNVKRSSGIFSVGFEGWPIEIKVGGNCTGEQTVAGSVFVGKASREVSGNLELKTN